MKAKGLILIILLFAVLVFALSGCWPGSRVAVIEFPSVVENVTRRTNVPLYNKSSYYAEVYVRGGRVAEMPPGASFHTVASLPFRTMELPVAALLYDADEQYVGCYTDVLHLYDERTREFRVTDRRIRFVDDRSQLTGIQKYHPEGRSVEKLPVPRLKHTLMVQVVYNSNLPGVLRMNGAEVKSFKGGPVHGEDRIFYHDWNLMNYRRRGQMIFDVKYHDGRQVFGYSKEFRVNFYISRPEAYQTSFGPEVYKD